MGTQEFDEFEMTIEELYETLVVNSDNEHYLGRIGQSKKD